MMPDYTKSVAHLFLDETSSAGCCTSGGGGGGGDGGGSVGCFSAGGFDESSSSAGGGAASGDKDSVEAFGVGSGGGLSPGSPTAPAAPPPPPATGAAAAGAAGSQQSSPTPSPSSPARPLSSSPAGGGGRLTVDVAKAAAGVGGGGRGVGRLDGVGGEVGLAQGYFGVYDGHCGSEAVQFVRDRLHAMVGEHPSFWKVWWATGQPRRRVFASLFVLCILVLADSSVGASSGSEGGHDVIREHGNRLRRRREKNSGKGAPCLT